MDFGAYGQRRGPGGYVADAATHLNEVEQRAKHTGCWLIMISA